MFTLEEALEAAKDRKEFSVKRYNGLIRIDYIVTFSNSFSYSQEDCELLAVEKNISFEAAEIICKKNAEIRKQFRGIVFSDSGELLSLPLHKFFNVNQVEETQYNLISDCKADIYEKLDGSMIHFFIHDGKLLSSTRGSTATVQAQVALQYVEKNPTLKAAIVKEVNDGFTPIFELVGPTNQIVVSYQSTRLVYLISRDRENGSYIFNEEFADRSNRYCFEFNEIYNNVNKTEFEGYVCHLDNGMIVKIKTSWYTDRHRAVDALMRPAHYLYQVVFDGHMDDLIAIAVETYHPGLNKIYEEAQNDLLNKKIELENQFNHLMDIFKEYVYQNDWDNIEKSFSELSLLEAIKLVRSKTNLSLSDCKNYVQTLERPIELIQKFEKDKIKSLKFEFTKLVRNNYPEMFDELISLYMGKDPEEKIKDKLMQEYRKKHTHKLYIDLELE